MFFLIVWIGTPAENAICWILAEKQFELIGINPSQSVHLGSDGMIQELTQLGPIWNPQTELFGFQLGQYRASTRACIWAAFIPIMFGLDTFQIVLEHTSDQLQEAEEGHHHLLNYRQRKSWCSAKIRLLYGAKLVTKQRK